MAIEVKKPSMKNFQPLVVKFSQNSFHNSFIPQI